MGQKIGSTSQRSASTWKVEKKLVRTAWKRNNRCKETANENQVKNKQEIIESMEISELLSKGRDLSDLPPAQYKRSWARGPSQGQWFLAQSHRPGSTATSSGHESIRFTEHCTTTGHVLLSLIAVPKSLHCPS